MGLRTVWERDVSSNRYVMSDDPCKGLVADDRMNVSLCDFYLRAAALLREEQAKPLPNNALIDFICNAVRLGRETSADAYERLRIHIPEDAGD